MKAVLFEIAKKITEAKGDIKVQMACAGTLKQMFIKMGYDNKTANQFALDAIKITMKAALNCAV